MKLNVIMAVGKYAMSKATFYDEAKSYWEQISPTVNGMLGGYGSISNIDVKGSINFLKPMLLVNYIYCVNIILHKPADKLEIF